MDKQKTKEIETTIQYSILKDSIGKSFNVKLFKNSKM